MRASHRLLALVLLGSLGSLVRGDEPKTETPPDRATLEKQFAEKMTGVVMVGKFTILDQILDLGPRPDKYTITKVEKKDGNNWLFIARVEYDLGSYPVAVKVPIEWAGTTPVIPVTNLEIPLVGKGVFSAHVLFEGDRYAGTWSHDKVGGHMYGRLERPKEEGEAAKDEKKVSTEKANENQPDPAKEKSAAPAKTKIK